MDDYYKRSPKYLGYDIPREKKRREMNVAHDNTFQTKHSCFFNAGKQIIFSVCPTTQ